MKTNWKVIIQHTFQEFRLKRVCMFPFGLKRVIWWLNYILPCNVHHLALNFFNSVEKWTFLFSDSQMGSFHWSWWLPLSKALRSWPFSDRPSLFTGAGLSEASPHYLTYFFSIVNMFSIAFSRVEIVLRLIFFCKMLAHVYFCCSWCNLHLDKKFDCWQQSGGGEWLIVGQCCKTLPNAKRIENTEEEKVGETWNAEKFSHISPVSE